MFECVKSFPIYISMAVGCSVRTREEELLLLRSASLRNFLIYLRWENEQRMEFCVSQKASVSFLFDIFILSFFQVTVEIMIYDFNRGLHEMDN